jgi:hypothetical protein
MAASYDTSFGQISGQKSQSQSNISPKRATFASPKPEIAFVNVTDSSGLVQDAETRKLVRAHVMRGYQRQKQAQEEAEHQRYHQQWVGVPKAPEVSILPRPENEVPRDDFTHNLDSTLSEVVDWTAILDYHPDQSLSGPSQIVGQEVGGEWVPMTRKDSQSSQNALMNMSYDPGMPNYGFGQPEGSTYHLDSPQNFSMYLQQPELVPEEIECPLISQSLTLSLSLNALNSGMLDPFNAMPGLRNARAQALMYHCTRKPLNSSLKIFITDIFIRQQSFG